jgi:RNA polymerase sigma-70 factor, ECF subfamily
MMSATDVRNELVALLPRLRRYALTLTGSVDQADELVQCALLRALDRLHQHSDLGGLDLWLFRIIKSVWLNSRRAAKVRQEEPISEAAEEVATDGLRAVEAKVALAQVRQAFERLSPEQREVLLLVCVEGYSYTEAAEFLEVPIGTVMSRLSRGRAALAAIVGVAGQGNVTPFRARASDGG